MDEIKRRQELLKHSLTTKKIKLNWHESGTSFLEGVFARGDRRLSDVIETAWRKGCKLDGWEECLRLDDWMSSFDDCGISPEFYANRERTLDEILPWDHLDYGVTKSHLIREYNKAHSNETTPHCREKCAGCGANKLNGGECDALRESAACKKGQS